MSGNCQGNVREFWTNSNVATLIKLVKANKQTLHVVKQDLLVTDECWPIHLIKLIFCLRRGVWKHELKRNWLRKWSRNRWRMQNGRKCTRWVKIKTCIITCARACFQLSMVSALNLEHTHIQLPENARRYNVYILGEWIILQVMTKWNEEFCWCYLEAYPKSRRKAHIYVETSTSVLSEIPALRRVSSWSRCILSLHCVLAALGCDRITQGGHGTGKTGNLDVHFSRQGKHREFAKKYLKYDFTRGICLQHRENFEVLKLRYLRVVMRLSYNFLTFEANNELVNNPINYQYFCSRLYCICDCSFGDNTTWSCG